MLCKKSREILQDEKLQPKNRNFKMFKKWFDVEIHSMVIDLVDEGIEKEELYID